MRNRLPTILFLATMLVGIIASYAVFNSTRQAERASFDIVADDIIDCCKTVVRMEDKFIDLAFEMGPVEGMTASDIKSYIRYIADWRLGQLGLPTLYGMTEHPLPWLVEILNGVEHANFFEARATEYSKGASKGDWHGADGVWDMFEKTKKEAALTAGQA